MYLCYVDESGTPEVPGTTSHFVLAAISIPIWHWHDADHEVDRVKKRYGLEGRELHTGWLLRKYPEQAHIADFDKMPWDARRAAVERERTVRILALQRLGGSKLRQEKKTFIRTQSYIHLTLGERQAFVRSVADTVANWGYARLFAECIDKVHDDPVRTGRAIDEQAFEQIVSRFEQFLVNTEEVNGHKNFGLIVHDNSETIAKKHTDLMRSFHRKGTLWTKVSRLVETPFFVDSSLTGMVQVADLCSYSLRRYLENGESDLFSRVFNRAHRVWINCRRSASLCCPKLPV
jgi:hypothetical protein